MASCAEPAMPTATSVSVLAIPDAFKPQHGTVTFNSQTGSFTYTPDEDWVGNDWFSYQLTDGVYDAYGPGYAGATHRFG